MSMRCTIRHSIARSRKRRGVSSIIGMVFFILIVFVAFTVISMMFSSFVSYTSTVNNTNRQELQNQETSLAIPGFAFGSQSPSSAGSSSNSVPPYVQITLTNSQTSPTPNPFQDRVTWNPSLYSAYEDTNLGNIRFCSDTLCNIPLYAWLESCVPVSCSNTGTSASAWVKLTSTIAGNGGILKIYMVFYSTSINFDGNYWGEAPTLSGTYGGYDNGANVFTFYDNFAGTSLSGKWSTNNHFGSYSVNNGLTISTIKNNGYSFLYSTTVAEPQVAESYMVSVSGDSPIQGVDTLSSYNGYGMYNGYSLNWFSGTDYLCPEVSGGAGTCSTQSVNVFPAGIWSVYWAAAGVEGSTDGAGNSLTSADNSVGAIANYGIYLGVTPDGTGSNLIQWARMRAYPPNNVMPSASLSSLVPTESKATSYSFERKVVFSQGQWWLFYCDGANIGYRTSPDGFTWSPEIIVTSSTGANNGNDFNLWLSGNVLYYVLTGGGQTNSFLWRYGVLQSSGTVSWTIPETSVPTTNTVYSYSSIVVDSQGNVWVALNTNPGTGTHIEVWKYSTGLWTKVNDVSSLPLDATPLLLPLSSGVALIYGDGGVTATTEVTTTLTGTSWSTPVSPPSYYRLFSSSAVAMGNNIYFVGLGSGTAGATTGTVDFWTFSSGASATSPETQLESSTSGWLSAISEEQSRSLIVYYGSGTDLYELASVNGGATWNSVMTLSVSETAISGLTSAYSGNGAAWTSGGSTPFSVRFIAIPTLTLTNNSPFPVHLISLYVYNPSANSLVHFDTNATGVGVSGQFDFWAGSGETMSIPLSEFAWTAAQSYVITVATDQGVETSFSIISPV